MKLLDLPQFQVFKSIPKVNGRIPVKILRHKAETVEDEEDEKKGKQEDRQDLWYRYIISGGEDNEFEGFQNRQSQDYFKNTEYFISFIAQPHRCAKYLGVWQVLSGKKGENQKWSYEYETKRIHELSGQNLDELSERLIIDWGVSTLSWVQWLDQSDSQDGSGSKEVNQILSPDHIEPFPGFYDFALSYPKLKYIIEKSESRGEWHAALSSVSGIYLILDVKSGKQYIGSASGKNGIWGRWCDYAKKSSGDNKLLTDLLNNNSKDYHNNFRFSILRTMDRGASKNEIIKHESLLKKKLGSKVFGLNLN